MLQHKDVEILVNHLSKSNIFKFVDDKPSDHSVVDLYRSGCHRLAGKNGGHAKHLERHILRLKKRHGEVPSEAELMVQEIQNIELNFATDSTLHPDIEVLAHGFINNELRDIVMRAEQYEMDHED